MLRAIPRVLGAAAVVTALAHPASFEALPQNITAPAAPHCEKSDGINGAAAAVGRPGVLPFVRTELFFGTSRSDGAVSDEEFNGFLNAVITPRFPDGLTTLKGSGQSRDRHGHIVREGSFVVILLYPFESCGWSGDKIQEIREAYKRDFDQQSVLRVDDPSLVWASY